METKYAAVFASVDQGHQHPTHPESLPRGQYRRRFAAVGLEQRVSAMS